MLPVPRSGYGLISPFRLMMTDQTPKTTPFSIRLTPGERADLERRAGKQALGDFIRERLFGSVHRPNQIASRAKPRTVTADREALATVLARLGQSDLARSLAALARAAHTGALPVSPEIEAAIGQACRDIAAMKSVLMAALGIKED